MTNDSTTYQHFTLPQASASTRVKAFKEHMKTNPELVFAEDGLPLTDKYYFEGSLRPPVGNKVKVSKKHLNSNFELQDQLVKGVYRLGQAASSWNATVYKSATEHLYSLLADVYALYGALAAAENDSKKLREAIRQHATQKLNLKFKSSTSNISILVTCVFKDIPAQRRSAYGLGLQSILQDFGPSLKKDAVVKIITDAGGIYELANPYPDDASSKSLDGESKHTVENKALATQLSANSLLTLTNAEFAELLAKPNTPYVAVVTKDANGLITVRGLSDENSTVRSAAKTVVKDTSKPKVPAKQAKDEIKLGQLFAEMIAERELLPT